MINNYEGDEKIKGLLERLVVGANEADGYTLVGGMLRYQGKIVIRGNAKLKRKIMQALHKSPLGRHLEVQKHLSTG